MPIDRNAAMDYARKFWNKLTDDDRFAHHNAGLVNVADARLKMKAPKKDWEGIFLSNDKGGEKGVFRNITDGTIKPDSFIEWDMLDDCTHYVSRCLKAEGITLTETSRANELAEAMIRSAQTKTLALMCSKADGQKVIDSGAFKPGDFVAYSNAKGNYTHTAMFVGRLTGASGDPGGITCHTVCRFQGLSKAWNGAVDDNWFLGGDHTYTLVHFAEDDAPLSAVTLRWLPGWWKAGDEFYYVGTNGRAYSTRTKPHRAQQVLGTSAAAGYYFDGNPEVVFVWRLPGGNVRVERWTAPSGKNGPSRKVGDFAADLSAVF
jgi:hypothetical protein